MKPVHYPMATAAGLVAEDLTLDQLTDNEFAALMRAGLATLLPPILSGNTAIESVRASVEPERPL